MTQRTVSVREIGNASCEFHTLSLLDLYRETVSCEECGYTEDADPEDIAEQYRILKSLEEK